SSPDRFLRVSSFPRRGRHITAAKDGSRHDLPIEDPRLSDRVQKFPESVIREMTRIAAVHDAINLSQGYPDFDPPRELTEAAARDRGTSAWNGRTGPSTRRISSPRSRTARRC